MNKKRIVGILGTSANPLHEGHIAMAEAALRTLPLDEVVLMVTPHNPVKDLSGYASIEHRMHLAHLTALTSKHFGTSLKVSEFEVLLKRFGDKNDTATLLRHYSDMYQALQPVWMMGADNLSTLHEWGHWTDIMEQYPVVIFGRSVSNDAALNSIAARQYASTQKSASEFRCEVGTWCLLSHATHPASSTEIRTRILEGEYPQYIPKGAVDYIREFKLFGCTA